MVDANYEQELNRLLSDPNKLKEKKPFMRGADREMPYHPKVCGIGEKISAVLPSHRGYVVSQEQFLRELDPNCHDVLFDENIPSICVKVADNDFRDIKYNRMAIPLQDILKSTQVVYLTTHKMQFTQVDNDPTETQIHDFTTFKQYWDLRNQDGMKNKMVDTQLSCGDAGLLYYFNRHNEIKSRILSFADGYVLCPHNDQNGDRILESVYYTKDNVEYIDSYDDTYMYRWTKGDEVESEYEHGWHWHTPVKHGFAEIPLITKRGDVAWNNVQGIIEAYEELFNVFNAIQKRFGWGIFYVKGKFKDKGKKIAGNIVLNDTSIDGKGDAKFLTPPTPEGMMDTLKNLLRTVQLSSRTTFILPDDIRLSGDVSGLAVQLTKELDLQLAMQKVIDWQNVADKMVRLFKYGLSVELVNKGINPTAITDFENLHINAKFKVWRPFNDYEFNQMLTILHGNGLISQETGVEMNTISKPDEMSRINRERIKAQERALEQMEMTQQMSNESDEGSGESVNKSSDDDNPNKKE